MLSDTLQPKSGQTDASTPCSGIELRDWFAGLALQEIMDANDGNLNTAGIESHGKDWVQLAYQVADMMYEARTAENKMDRYEDQDDDPVYEANGGGEEPEETGNIIDMQNSQPQRKPDLPEPAPFDNPFNEERGESGDQGNDDVVGFGERKSA